MDDGFLGTILAVVIGKAVWDGSKSKLPPAKQREVNQDFGRFLGWAVIGFMALAMLAGAIDKAFSQTSQHTFRDSSGRVMGYSTTNNAGTVYRNERGQTTGRSVTNSAGTTFYNSRGQQTGSMRK